jgi:hypothetical protein
LSLLPEIILLTWKTLRNTECLEWVSFRVLAVVCVVIGFD